MDAAQEPIFGAFRTPGAEAGRYRCYFALPSA